MKQGLRGKLPLLLGGLAGCLLLVAAAGLAARWAWSSRQTLISLLPFPRLSATAEADLAPVSTTLATSTETPPTLTPHPPLVIAAQETSEESKSPRYIIQASWPVLDWGGDPRVEAFNQAIETRVRGEIQAFKENLLQLSDDPALNELSSSLQIGYTTQNYDRGVLSVLLRISFYSAGAAHPGSYFLAVNYDLREGKELVLADLFQPGADYLASISSACLEDLNDRGVLGWEEGALPVEENYRTWNVTPDGLLITFDEYQVAPYAAGPQSVIIPYETLSEFIRPDGPLSGFVHAGGLP